MMTLPRHLMPLLLAFVVAACADPAPPHVPSYLAAQPPAEEGEDPEWPLAPELDQGIAWLNTDAPITLADLRGHVVLMDFWTYGCVNCLHLLPVMRQLEDEFAGQPLVVIGVHSGKFDTEQGAASIAQAVKQYDIRHPTLVDDGHTTMWAYEAAAWPTSVLVDATGAIRTRVSGEFSYEPMRNAIAALLAEAEADGVLTDEPLDLIVDPNEGSTTPLLYPSSVDAREDGTVVITDSAHHRIVVLSPEAPLPIVVGNGLEGFVDGALFEARFARPQGTAWVGDILYVADTENHAIRRIDLAEETVTTVAGTGAKGTDWYTVADGWMKGGTMALRSPWAIEPVGEQLVIAMAGSHQLWRLVPETSQIRVFSGSGLERLTDGAPAEAAYSQPSGLATGLDGATLYVADSESSAIRAVDAESGEATTLVGKGLFTFGDFDAVGVNARLQHPIGVVVAADGTLVLADTYNDKLKRLDLDTLAVAAWDWSPPYDALAEPRGLSRAGDLLFVADTNNHRVVVRDTAAGTTDVMSLNGLKAPALTGAVSLD